MPTDAELLRDDDLRGLRIDLVNELEKLEDKRVDREPVARTLELYADAVREGYTRPASIRGQWWRETHLEADDEPATGAEGGSGP